MDPDEILARQLQEEENRMAAAAAAMLRGPRPPAASGQAAFAAQVQDGLRKAQGYEDELAQAMALSMMPLEEMRGAAEDQAALSAAMGEAPPLALEDALAQELLAWFKTSFFSWVNNPDCDFCGSSATRLVSNSGPTAEEAEHGAGRAEVYCCASCGGTTRFPRYNDPVKLLETRRGRCGEWANCFTLCCRAAGLEARLVLDWTDHIWTEYWSQALGRWVHLDACEAAYDKPLLYSAGWGKKLSYLVAVGRQGVADVSRRYVRDWGELRSRRTQVTEEWLAAYLTSVNQQLRAALPEAERAALAARDAADAAHMAGSAGLLTAAELALPGRESGSAAWRAARGEDGACRPAAAGTAGAAAGTAAAPPADGEDCPPGATRYRWAKDESLLAAHRAAGWGDRVVGGAVRASGENPPGETAGQAVDGNPHTKWLDFGGARGGSTWLEYRLPSSQPPVVLQGYALTSANDSPERDPAHLLLEAFVEEQEQREGQGQGERRQQQQEQPEGEAAEAEAAAAAEAGGKTSEGGQAGTGAPAAAAGAAGTAGTAAAAAGTAAPRVPVGHWVRVDERRGVAFPGRHCRLQFQLAPAAAQQAEQAQQAQQAQQESGEGSAPQGGVAAHRFRLRIVSVANPAAANSVQLACWDLYRREGSSTDLYCQQEGGTEPEGQQGVGEGVSEGVAGLRVSS